MKVGETIRIQKSCGDWFFVHIEEFHPYEPSAYVHVPFWTAVSNPGTDAEQSYEIEEDGSVYLVDSDSNERKRNVGEVPELAALYKAML